MNYKQKLEGFLVIEIFTPNSFLRDSRTSTSERSPQHNQDGFSQLPTAVLVVLVEMRNCSLHDCERCMVSTRNNFKKTFLQCQRKNKTHQSDIDV